MILRSIRLGLNRDRYLDELQVPFSFATRYVAHYIQQRIRKEKFEAQGFNLISVEGHPSPSDECKIVPESALKVQLPFDPKEYAKLETESRHEFYLAMLDAGFRKCAQQFDIPMQALQKAMQEFREGGYKNEWAHKTKLFRETGLRAALLCSLNMDRFQLTLTLERKGELVFEKAILETKPDEIIFAHKFRDVIVEEGILKVLNMFEKPIFELDLASVV